MATLPLTGYSVTEVWRLEGERGEGVVIQWFSLNLSLSPSGVLPVSRQATVVATINGIISILKRVLLITTINGVCFSSLPFS